MRPVRERVHCLRKEHFKQARRIILRCAPRDVEPVFGIIQSVLGFRLFRLRGHPKVPLEWTLVCLAYNLKRLHRLGVGLKLAATT